LRGMKGFSDRIGDNKFHGGDTPDDCDFHVFGVLKAKFGARTFERFVEKECGRSIDKWLIRMNMLCKYEERFFIDYYGRHTS
jgi:hypothetical protein